MKTQRTETYALRLIKAEDRFQARAVMDQFVIDRYASQLKAGVTFPPVTIFQSPEMGLILVDGFHRYVAHERAKIKQIAATVIEGTERDALLFALSANQEHGMPRTNADKRNAVTALLSDEEWVKWSDAEIARKLGVSDRFVASVRAEVSPNGSEIRKVKRGASVYDLKVKNIGITARIMPMARALLADTHVPEDRTQTVKLGDLDSDLQVRVAEKIVDNADTVEIAVRKIRAESGEDIKQEARKVLAKTLRPVTDRAFGQEPLYKTVLIDLQYMPAGFTIDEYVANPHVQELRLCFGKFTHLYIVATQGTMQGAFDLLRIWKMKAQNSMPLVLALKKGIIEDELGHMGPLMIFAVPEGMLKAKGVPEESALATVRHNMNRVRVWVRDHDTPRLLSEESIIERSSPGPYLRLFKTVDLPKNTLWYSPSTLDKLYAGKGKTLPDVPSLENQEILASTWPRKKK